MSRLDQIFRGLLLTKFFNKGWGSPQDLKRIFEFRKILSNRDTCQHLVGADYPITIDKKEIQKEVQLIEGHFLSPLVEHLPGIMPKEVETAKFQMILPKDWENVNTKWNKDLRPVCIHLGGTGDHGFGRRRRLLARPLLKQAGIASIILENPYYGCRKPKGQTRSCLRNVSDLFVMGGGLVLECMVLLHWCENNGYGPLGITGISMGGFMASLAASSWTKPLSLIPCLSWSTASTVFTRGVLSSAIDWKLLQSQFFEEKLYEDELSKLICSPEKNQAFQLGVEFAKNYPTNSDDGNIYQKQYIKLLQEDKMNNHNEIPYIHNQNCNSKISNGWKKYHTSTFRNYSSSQGDANSSSLKISQKLFDLFKFNRSSDKIETEAVDFMRGVMDECTHLGNFSVPVDPSLVIIVIAADDAYIPMDDVISLQDMWKGAQVRYLNSGHIGAFLTKQADIRQAVIDSFDLQVKKYYI